MDPMDVVATRRFQTLAHAGVEMSRSNALRRAVVGILYLPLYYVLLYPVVFFAGVILTAIALVIQLVTGSEPELKPQLTSSAWESISQPVTWVFSGDDRDKPTWVP